MEDRLFSRLTIEDMPNADLRLVAETCGIEIALKLLKELPGIRVDIPKRGALRIARGYIIENYNGKNAKKLAIETGLSENYIYKILKKARKSIDHINQMDLFERS